MCVGMRTLLLAGREMGAATATAVIAPVSCLVVCLLNCG